MIRRKPYLLFSALAAITASRAARGSVDDWPLPLHDACNTCVTNDHVSLPFRLAWRVSTGGPKQFLLATTGAVCAGQWPEHYSGGRAVVSASLFDTAGHELWRMEKTFPLYLHGSRLVAAVASGNTTRLECYDWRTRKSLWSQPLGGGFPDLAGGVVRDGLLYIASPSGPSVETADGGRSTPYNGLVVRIADGKVVVQTRMDSEPGAIWALDGKHVYFAHRDYLQLASPKTLQREYGFYVGRHNIATVTGPIIVSAGGVDYLFAADTASRKVLWDQNAKRATGNCLAVGPAGRRVVMVAHPYHVVAIDVQTGHELWCHQVFAGSSGYYDELDSVFASAGRYVFVGGAQCEAGPVRARRVSFVQRWVRCWRLLCTGRSYREAAVAI